MYNKVFHHHISLQNLGHQASNFYLIQIHLLTLYIIQIDIQMKYLDINNFYYLRFLNKFNNNIISKPHCFFLKNLLFL